MPAAINSLPPRPAEHAGYAETLTRLAAAAGDRPTGSLTPLGHRRSREANTRLHPQGAPPLRPPGVVSTDVHRQVVPVAVVPERWTPGGDPNEK